MTGPAFSSPGALAVRGPDPGAGCGHLQTPWGVELRQPGQWTQAWREASGKFWCCPEGRAPMSRGAAFREPVHLQRCWLLVRKELEGPRGRKRNGLSIRHRFVTSPCFPKKQQLLSPKQQGWVGVGVGCAWQPRVYAPWRCPIFLFPSSRDRSVAPLPYKGSPRFWV